MKECFKCNEVKPLADFYKHPQMSDGTVNKCKECNKRDVRENRKRRIDYYRQYDRQRMRDNREYTEGYQQQYRENNPIRYKAHTTVGNAIRSGRLVRPDNCDSCYSAEHKIHGHHDDYSKPLEVRWFCPPCHKAWHKENGVGLNG